MTLHVNDDDNDDDVNLLLNNYILLFFVLISLFYVFFCFFNQFFLYLFFLSLKIQVRAQYGIEEINIAKIPNIPKSSKTQKSNIIER